MRHWSRRRLASLFAQSAVGSTLPTVAESATVLAQNRFGARNLIEDHIELSATPTTSDTLREQQSWTDAQVKQRSEFRGRSTIC